MDVRDYFVEVKEGNIPGHSVVNKFGRNDSILNNFWSIVSPSSPSGVFPSSGVLVRIKAGGDAADTFDGVGARTVTVVGISTEGEEFLEVLATSGVNESLPTTNRFCRVYRSYVSSVGTYMSANAADIILEDSDGNNNMITIIAEEGQTQHGAYSIPLGKTGYLLSVDIDADGNKAADFRLFVRENLIGAIAPVVSRQLKLYWDGVLGQVSYRPRSPSIILPALSDIWMEARGGGAATQVSVDFEILLIDDPTGPIKQA